MNCPHKNGEIGSLLDYVSGRLEPAQRASLERHMRECAACAGFAAEQAALWTALDLWEAEPVSLNFNRGVWQRIEELNSAPWHARLLESLHPRAWKPALPLAAAALLVTAGFVFDHRGPAPAVAGPQGSAAVSAGVSSAEADQAEKALDDLQLMRQLDSAGANRSM